MTSTISVQLQICVRILNKRIINRKYDDCMYGQYIDRLYIDYIYIYIDSIYIYIYLSLIVFRNSEITFNRKCLNIYELSHYLNIIDILLLFIDVCSFINIYKYI